MQGVGFRPFVHRIGERYGITGFVINKGPFVEIRAQGSKEDMDSFLSALSTEAPSNASVLSIDVSDDDIDQDFDSFEIRESSGRARDGIILIPPDAGICEDCKRSPSPHQLYSLRTQAYYHRVSSI